MLKRRNFYKKALIVITAVVLALGLAVLLFNSRFKKMSGIIKNEYAKISRIDLNKVADGVCPGRFGYFLVSVSLEVAVKNHRITDIKTVEQRCGKGYEGRDVIGRILKAQSPKVDAVTGATGSSMCIMIAVNNALLKKMIRYQ